MECFLFCSQSSLHSLSLHSWTHYVEFAFTFNGFNFISLSPQCCIVCSVIARQILSTCLLVESMWVRTGWVRTGLEFGAKLQLPIYGLQGIWELPLIRWARLNVCIRDWNVRIQLKIESNFGSSLFTEGSWSWQRSRYFIWNPVFCFPQKSHWYIVGDVDQTYRSGNLTAQKFTLTVFTIYR